MTKSIINAINEANRIIIHRHSRPDGDALGSQIGLKEIIQENFKNKKVYVVGDMINRYSFIGQMDNIPTSFYDDSLVFVLDVSEQCLISDERFKLGKKIIKIDHHIFRESFGDIEYVDESFESCCGLITYFAMQENLMINKIAAQALYTGLVTDSGRFRFDSTTERTFRIASKLLESGIDINDIYNTLYIDDFDTVLLRAKYTLKIQFTKHNVAYIMTTNEELKKENIEFFVVSRSMVNTMAGIKNVDIWVNFTEDNNNNVVTEIRSNKYNINQIAVKYGGGGHLKASGCTIKDFEVAKKLLDDLDSLVEVEDE